MTTVPNKPINIIIFSLLIWSTSLVAQPFTVDSNFDSGTLGTQVGNEFATNTLSTFTDASGDTVFSDGFDL